MAQVSTKDFVAHGTSVAEHCTQRAFRSDMHVTISLSVLHVLFVRWESKTPASNTPLSCGSDFYSKSFAPLPLGLGVGSVCPKSSLSLELRSRRRENTERGAYVHCLDVQVTVRHVPAKHAVSCEWAFQKAVGLLRTGSHRPSCPR